MAHNVLRWVLAVVALLVVGPLLSAITAFSPAPDASGGATPMLSTAPVMGAAAWIVAIALAGGFGLIVTRLTTWRLGVTCIGLCLVWSAWGTPRLDDLTRLDTMGDPTVRLAIDGLLVTLLGCGCAWVCTRQGGSDDHTADDASPALYAYAVGGALVGALLAAFVIARDERIGQTMGAAVLAGFAGGMIGRGLASKVRVSWVLVGFPLAALAAPLIGRALTDGAIWQATNEGSVSALLRVMPADWLAGVLIGFPAGSAQGASMAHRTEHPGGEFRAGSPAS
ncbi:MAG: hypothetical protein Tsb0013_19910 [Phycisphaerales bacterium]